MNYIKSFFEYIKSFIKKDDDDIPFIYNFYTKRPSFFDYGIIDDIDFDKTPMSDIVIKLNEIKSEYDFNISYYENMYNVCTVDKLVKLKYFLILCLESKTDTTDIMIKHIMKYKGEKYPNMINNHKMYHDLEKRYLNLINDDDDDCDNDNNDDGKDGMLVSKTKIAMSV